MSNSKVTVPSNLSNLEDVEFRRYASVVIAQLVQVVNELSNSITSVSSGTTSSGTVATVTTVQETLSCGVFSTAAGPVDVTNLVINNFKSTGSPIRVRLVGADASGGQLKTTSSNAVAGAQVTIFRGTTTIFSSLYVTQIGGVAAVLTGLTIPFGDTGVLDNVPAGTYTYRVQLTNTLGATAELQRVKLQVYEDKGVKF